VDKVERSRNRVRHAVTEMNVGLPSASLDEIEHSRHCACHAVTEMNVGLPSAESVRLARHGRPGQGSTDLGTAI